MGILCGDKRLIQELYKSPTLLNLIYSLIDYPEAGSQIVKLHEDLLCLFYLQAGSMSDFTRICTILSGPANYKLIILKKITETILAEPIKQESKIGTALLHLTYILEDSIVDFPDNVDNGLCLIIISRILYLLHKAELLYVSLPSISLFDERCSLNMDKPSNNIIETGQVILREGGFVRIMLKTLMKLVYFDKSKTAILLLRFYLLREKNLCKSIKEIGMVNKCQAKKHGNRKRYYNLIDLILKQNTDKMEFHYKNMDFFQNKIINKGAFSHLGISNSSPKSSKEKSFFETSPFYFLYLIASFTQIFHFELLEINNYKYFPTNEVRTKKLKELGTINPSKNLKKMSMLAQLLEDIVNSESLNNHITDLRSQLTSEFTKFIDSGQHRYLAYFYPKNIIKLQTVYSFLLQNPDQKEELEEEKAIETQETDYTSFKKSMKAIIFLIFETIKTTPGQFCDKYAMLILSQNFIQLIQPYLLFITSHNFINFDRLILSSMKKDQHFAIKHENETLKIISELEKTIIECFGFITVPKAKMRK